MKVKKALVTEKTQTQLKHEEQELEVSQNYHTAQDLVSSIELMLFGFGGFSSGSQHNSNTRSQNNIFD